MFLAGVSIVLAAPRRTARGASTADNFRHLAERSAKTIVVSQVLIWIARNEVRPQLINSLSQIALASLLVFAILQLPRRTQVLLLAGRTRP